ncbi:MAG TPA: HD domain-containing phosphohydrolase [Methylomirabilota bacterium]
MSDLIRGTVPAAPRPAPPREAPRPKAEETGDAPGAEEAAREAVRYRALEQLKQPRPAPETPPVRERESAVSPAGGAAALFTEFQVFLTGLRPLARSGEAFPWTEAQTVLARVIVALEQSPQLFWIAANPAPPAEGDYLAFHHAQVAVLSLQVARNLGYDRARLVHLGLAGTLIDVGLWQVPDGIVRRADHLSAEEQALYQSHPRLSAELIRKWGPPFPAIVDAVVQHHEREQGQGFPQGLEGAAIHQDAKILGMVDSYATLTAPPAGASHLEPHEVIREIVRSKNESFSAPLVKALLAEISVFPPGTIVRLNSGEVGRVVAVNRNHPLRPQVEVVTDSKGQALPTPRALDLSEAPFLYITGPVES